MSSRSVPKRESGKTEVFHEAVYSLFQPVPIYLSFGSPVRPLDREYYFRS